MAQSPGLHLQHRAEERAIVPEYITAMLAQRQSETFDSLRDLVAELEAGLAPSSTQLASMDPKDFSDEVFEEISYLGEGAGGLVHKVSHKPTGTIMARKTIITLRSATKQVLRELSITSSANHVNIIQCYGAYLSPLSAEVKILMEYCEGGNLEAIGKRIMARGAIVGEKVAGRLAEGVGKRCFFRISHTNAMVSLIDPTRSFLSSHQKDHPQRYQTIEGPSVSGRSCQIV